MFVHVRLFAMLRDRAGGENVEVVLPEGARGRGGRGMGARREHGLGDGDLPDAGGDGGEPRYAAADTSQSEANELALIPPVSGGESTFATGEGYERFMELVGNHVLELPRYVDLLGMRPLLVQPGTCG